MLELCRNVLEYYIRGSLPFWDFWDFVPSSFGKIPFLEFVYDVGLDGKSRDLIPLFFLHSVVLGCNGEKH